MLEMTREFFSGKNKWVRGKAAGGETVSRKYTRYCLSAGILNEAAKAVQQDLPATDHPESTEQASASLSAFEAVSEVIMEHYSDRIPGRSKENVRRVIKDKGYTTEEKVHNLAGLIIKFNDHGDTTYKDIDAVLDMATIRHVDKEEERKAKA